MRYRWLASRKVKVSGWKRAILRLEHQSRWACVNWIPRSRILLKYSLHRGRIAWADGAATGFADVSVKYHTVCNKILLCDIQFTHVQCYQGSSVKMVLSYKIFTLNEYIQYVAYVIVTIMYQTVQLLKPLKQTWVVCHAAEPIICAENLCV
jgi:hypothetical protein